MKKIKINKRLPKFKIKSLRHRKTIEQKVSDAIKDVPRITNDTVEDHREDVLGKARKYIYPLQHSKHRVVKISVSLIIIVVIAFLAFCGLDLYEFQGTSGFIYDITKILPFPVAKVDGTWVSYRFYLFELRRDMHYYSTQQQADFSTTNGKAQLSHLKQVSLNYAIQAALVDKIARQDNITVSSTEVNQQLNILKNQNRLGSSSSVLKEVLSQYYGWSENDFKRELKQEILTQMVDAKLDVSVSQQAENVLKQIQAGANFAQLAAKYSDDNQTKNSGGEYPGPITIDDQQINPVIVNELFSLKPGQVSGILNTGYSLEIVETISRSGNSVRAAHIQFNLQNINYYLAPMETKQKISQFISF